LNRRSRAPEARGVARLSHTLIIEERPARIELAIPPWQGDGLPLHHGRLLLAQPNCQRSRAPSEDRTHAAALRKRCHSTRPSVLIHSVGSVGIEPTSAGLRDRCITLSATIPKCVFHWVSCGFCSSHVDLSRLVAPLVALFFAFSVSARPYDWPLTFVPLVRPGDRSDEY
jgi:hypothetical protein